MTTTNAGSANALPDPLPAASVAAPVPHPETFRNPGLGFLLALGAASIAMMGALLSVGILTLPLKANALDPSGATTIISIAAGFAGFAGLVANPIVGQLSDRTTGRLGRRRPYVFLAALFIPAGAVILLAAPSAAFVAVGWVVMTLGQACALTSLGSAIPDQLAPERRGPASALFGVAGTGGAIVGILLGSVFSPNLALMVMVPALLATLFLVLFALIMRDTPLAAADRKPFRLRDVLATFWVNPIRHRGYALAFVSRFAVFCAIAAVNAYQAIYLIAGLHVPPTELPQKILLATLLSGITALVFATVFGKVSDIAKRRKPFVVVAAAIFTVGLVLLATAHSFSTFLVAVVIMGFGQGVYLAVDFALITQVLPDQSNPAKDIGIMNLASSLPNIVVPAIAPALLAIDASATNPQNFAAFFIAAAIAGALGALLILPIRNVR